MHFDVRPAGVFVYRYVVRPAAANDPRSAGYLTDAHALGFSFIEQIACQDIFFIEGSLQETDVEALSSRLLSDPITQAAECTRLGHAEEITRPALQLEENQHLVEVALRPGVTDPVAEQIVRASREMGIRGVQRASTGLRFLVRGSQLDEESLSLLANRLLANPIIQRFALGEITPVFPQPAEASGLVAQIPIQSCTEEALMVLSHERRAALDLEEMLAIQRMYRTENRDMTDIEFETIAQTWSEHCVHKTFKALITLENLGDGFSIEQTQIDNLLNTYLRAATDTINAPWVRSAFVDNAGILDFDADHEISFKVETHNHPSAIEPFGGANTGVGGVIRDVIGVSAKPIAATDVLCFGPAQTSFEDLPAGVLHPRRIRAGVIAGVQDYGNKIGIPTVSGAILYDPGYTANPLVFCGCVGIAPKGSHPRAPQPGDRVIVLGGRTGRDGLRGATFSSMTMDAQTGEVAGASVQIGAPIVEKGLIDVIVQARDLRLYTAITDCGAGGLSSAVGEMASQSGADVDLCDVQLKYPGLAPWEIWLSEAQERMLLAVPPEKLPELQALCDLYAVELTDIGAFTTTNRLVVRYGAAVVLDLANNFLHEGIPQRKLKALLPALLEDGSKPAVVPLDQPGQVLLDLLAHPNIASKENVIRIYDHEVLGGTLVKPLTGARDDGPSDAVVLKPAGTAGTTALVLGAGINPEYGKRSAYRMAWSVVDEAVRNAVAVGADPSRIALLDNFCWGDPKNPATLGTLVEACRGCYDAACYYGTPFISGKDSLNNEYMGKDGQRHAIPPTLLISSIGVIHDLHQTVTMDLKQPGSSLYLAGTFDPHLGGSHYNLVTGQTETTSNPPGMPKNAREVYQALNWAIKSGLVIACHDLSEGGLAAAAAEMCIGGRLGLDLMLPQAEISLTHALFGETNGCLLVEIAPECTQRFEAQFAGLPLHRLGTVVAEQHLSISDGSASLISLSLEALITAWQTVDGR